MIYLEQTATTLCANSQTHNRHLILLLLRHTTKSKPSCCILSHPQHNLPVSLRAPLTYPTHPPSPLHLSPPSPPFTVPPHPAPPILSPPLSPRLRPRHRSVGAGWRPGVEENRPPASWGPEDGAAAARGPRRRRPCRCRPGGRRQELGEGGAEADRAMEQRAFRALARPRGPGRGTVGARVLGMAMPAGCGRQQRNLQQDRRPAVKQKRSRGEPAEQARRASARSAANASAAERSPRHGLAPYSSSAPKLRAGSISGRSGPAGRAAAPAARGRKWPRPASASSSPSSTITSPRAITVTGQPCTVIPA